MRYQAGFSITRLLLWLTGLLLAVVIILPVAFLVLFNPNDYKQELATVIHQKSGLPLIISGDITVHYFPWLGFAAKDIHLAQPARFGKDTFMQAKEMDFKVPLKDLLKRKLNIETLNLKGVNLHLIKLSDGTTNWDQILEQVNKSSTNKSSSRPTTSNTPTATENKKSLSIALMNIAMDDANIFYEDKTSNQTFNIQHLQIKGHVKDKPDTFDVSSQFDIAMQPTNQPKIEGHGKIQGDVSFNKTVLANLDTHLWLQMNGFPAEWQEIDINAHLSADDKALKLTDVAIKTATTAKGAITVPYNATSPITFSFKVDELDLNHLPKFGETQQNTAPATAGASTGQNPVIAKHTGDSRKVQGDITISRVLANNLTLEQVNAKVNKTGDLLNINPLTANLYQGKISTSITKNLGNDQAPVIMNGKLTQMELKPFLTALKKQASVSGLASADFALNFVPSGPQGTVNVNISNGNLQGVDVKYYISLAQSLLKKTENTVQDTKSTPFEQLTATLRLHDAIIDNNDLLIKGPDFKAQGEGSVNYGNETLSYKMKVLRQYQDGREHPNTIPVALRIKGSLNKPKVEPDLDVYLKTSVKNEVNKEINKQLNKHIDKLIGDKKDPNDSTDQNASNEKEDPVDKAIKKGLEKLFK